MSKKKDQILKVGKDLFYRYGMKKVSVEEICQEAEVSKMTFYKFFKNKIELVINIYETMTKESFKLYRDIMDSELKFATKIEKILALKREGVHDLSKEFYNDLMKSDIPEIQAMIQNAITQNLQMVINDFVQAQKKGEIRKDIKPEFLMFYMNHMMEMAQDSRLANMYQTSEDLILELNNFFFYGILPRNDIK